MNDFVKRLGLFFLISLLATSCQYEVKDRHISSIEQVESGPIGSFFIESLSQVEGVTDDTGLEELVAKYNFEYQQRLYDSSETRAIKVVLEEAELPEGQAIGLATEVDEAGIHIIKVIRSSNEENVTSASKRLLDQFFKQVNNTQNIVNAYSFFEVMFNAKKGDYRAKIALEKLKLKAVESDVSLTSATEMVEANIEQLEKEFKPIKKEMKVKETARKAIMDTLDKLNDELQLKALIQNNDRNGVANLFERYLPWEQMTPIENSYWTHILNRMRNPIEAKDKVLVYRGTYGDRLFPQMINGSQLEYEDAVKQANLGTMSTILTRNQGTYNRRLRSLQTMYGKKIASNPRNIKSDFVETARLTTMLKQHSIEAQGSPFLSFTSDFDTGYRFGFSIADDKTVSTAKGAMGAFLMDPELLMFNQMSGFKGEMEYLAPLITFPDEMVGFFDEDYMEKESREQIKERLHNGLKTEMKRIYGEDGADIASDILARSKEFNDYEKAYLVPKLKAAPVATSEGGGFVKKVSNFFSGIKNKLSSDPTKNAKVIAEMPKLNNCLYAIKSFLN